MLVQILSGPQRKLSSSIEQSVPSATPATSQRYTFQMEYLNPSRGYKRIFAANKGSGKLETKRYCKSRPKLSSSNTSKYRRTYGSCCKDPIRRIFICLMFSLKITPKIIYRMYCVNEALGEWLCKLPMPIIISSTIL